MKRSAANFEGLVGRIQATSEALQQDALVVINRSVTARAWLTGYYIKDYCKFYHLYPELGVPFAGYLLSRFGKGQSLISQLAIDVGDAATKGYTLSSLLDDASNVAVAEKARRLT